MPFDETGAGSAEIDRFAGNQSAMLNKAIQPTLRQRLQAAEAEATRKLKTIQEARELLDRNPDMEKLTDLLGRFHF